MLHRTRTSGSWEEGPGCVIMASGASAWLVIKSKLLKVMERYLRVGQRECWRKMPMLATRLRIAHALREVQAALAAAGSSGSLAESFELVQEHSRAVDAVAPALASGHASTAPTSFRRSDSMLVF